MKLIAKGNTAEIFDYSDGIICKLFYEGYPEESVYSEFYNAGLLYDLKLPVPNCYSKIFLYNRHGLLYEKIDGIDLINYLMDKTKYNMILSTLVNTHKEILKHECKLPYTYKDFIRKTIRDKDTDFL